MYTELVVVIIPPLFQRNMYCKQQASQPRVGLLETPTQRETFFPSRGIPFFVNKNTVRHQDGRNTAHPTLPACSCAASGIPKDRSPPLAPCLQRAVSTQSHAKNLPDNILDVRARTSTRPAVVFWWLHRARCLCESTPTPPAKASRELKTAR